MFEKRQAKNINNRYNPAGTCLFLCIIWTVIIGITYFFALNHQKKTSEKFAEVQARAILNNNIIYPYLTSQNYEPDNREYPEKKNQSGSSIINPFLTAGSPNRKTYEKSGVIVHLRSLTPVNPNATPDIWEITALKSFRKAKKEYRIIEIDNNIEYLRMMFPLVTEEKCLACHIERSFSKGDLRGGISVSVPLTLYRKSEIQTVVRMTVAYVFIFLSGIIILITAFYKLNRHYNKERKTEAQLGFQAKLLETVEQSVVSTDKDGKILYWNPFAEKLYGWKSSEVLGKNIIEVAVHDLKKDLSEEIYNRLNSKKSWSGELIARHRDGYIFPTLVTMSPIFDESNKLTAIIGVAIDVTIRKKLETQLQQTQKMESIGTLAGGIAHDFNNILAPIILHSQLAMDDLPPDSPLQMNMNEIYRAADRAKALVKQILTFAKKGNENKIFLKASSIIKEAINFLRSTIPATIDIRYDNNAKKDTIYANPTQINQIIMNLCTNASQAMKEKRGVIEVILDSCELAAGSAGTVSGLKAGQYLRITVKDNGCGIPSDKIEKIFEPYFTTKSPGEGTGLGLSIIHGIIKDYGGGITVKSEIDAGSFFQVYLPTIEVKIEDQGKKVTDYPGGSERILFVDDEKAAVDAVKTTLERLGYKITATSNSLEALDIFCMSPDAFDLVITDMTMPDMTGKDLILKIKEIRPDIPVILCTGYSDQINKEKAVEIGINEFLFKPVDKLNIANTIRNALKHSGR